MGWREEFADIANRKVVSACLACGSEDLFPFHYRVMLVVVDDDDAVRLDIRGDVLGTGTGLVCAAIICGACGFVRLHALAPYKHHGEGDTESSNGR